MCGIGGILFSTATTGELHRKIKILNELQRHRGPDSQSVLVQGEHAFCHQRLAIVDAAGGQQPFKDSTGRYIIVYNGELYNYRELRKDLSEHYPFKTDSDTEVMLAAFIIWGKDCLNRFNGMFAFLIWDTQTATAFAARDPLGVKPFVYYCDETMFAFASELKALMPIIDRRLEIDPYILGEYIVAPSLSGGGDKAIFKNIHYLEPGTFMRIDKSGIYSQKYYCFNWIPTTLHENDLTDQLSGEIENSVLLSLGDDMPMGIFLSGGLDSALIAAIAARHAKTPLSAFSIAFEKHSEVYFDPSTIVNSDDLPFAAELAERLSMPFHTVTWGQTCLKQLAKINDRIPAWEQEFSQHFLSRAAAMHTKAVFVGDAADETHYGYFFLLNEATNKSPLDLIHVFGGHKRIKLMSPQLKRQLDWQYFDAHYRSLAKESGFDFGKDAQENVLATSTLVLKRWLQRLLHNGDIHTMHFGLEARVPFANRSVLDVACLVHPHLGFKNGVEKFLLRQAAARWLQPSFYNRKKSALPRDPRLGPSYQIVLSSLLQGKNDFIDTFLDRPALMALCSQKTINESDRMILFNMISLINWGKHYVK